MTDKEISYLISYSLVLWPNQPVVDRKEQIVAWRGLLTDVNAAAAQAAVDAYAAAGNVFAPPPGVIRQHAILLTNDTGAPSPDEAWEEINTKIQTVGYQSTTLDYCHLGRACQGRECDHHTVTFSHPAITAIVEAMGWRELCLSSEQMADRAHFLRMYTNAVERLTSQSTKPPSVTAFEASRPAAIEGPPPTPVRPLPSGTVDEGERDDDAGLSAVRKARATVSKAIRFD